MKIASYEASILLVPEDDPLANMPEEAGRKRPIVTVRLRTDDGIEGIGVTLYGGRADAQPACRRRGSRAPRPSARTRCASRRSSPSCAPAIPAAGRAASSPWRCRRIDIALWDIKGKALDLPLWKLLGGHRDRVPTYASGALRRGLSRRPGASAPRRSCCRRAFAR